MKFKNTLFFILLFAVVFGFYIAQSKREAARLEQMRNASDDFKVQVEEKLPKFNKNQKITFIQVQELNRDETFWLEKQGASWQMVFPVRGLVDQGMAQGLAGMIKLAFEQKLLRPEDDWKTYGLDEPDIKIGVGTQGSSERHFLYLGKEAPLGSGIFARWDDRKAYFILPAAVKDAFRRSVYEMREKRVFLTPLPKMDRILVQIDNRTFEWTLRNQIWYWMEPLEWIGQPMKEDQMGAVIQLLSKLYVKEFLDGSDKDTTLTGISMISDRIQIRSGKNSETVYLGKEAGLKTAYYARRENEKELFLVDQTKIIQIVELLNAIEKANRPAETAAKPESTDAEK